MPVILALGTQRQAGLYVQGRPDLQSELQAIQTYMQKFCLKTNKKQKQQKKGGKKCIQQAFQRKRDHSYYKHEFYPNEAGQEE